MQNHEDVLLERLDASAHAVRELKVTSEAADEPLAELLASASWRITAPTRAMTDWLRRRPS